MKSKRWRNKTMAKLKSDVGWAIADPAGRWIDSRIFATRSRAIDHWCPWDEPQRTRSWRMHRRLGRRLVRARVVAEEGR